MRHDVTLPLIDGDPTAIYIDDWLVGIGAEVTEGAPLVLVEADKAQVGQVVATLEVP